MKQVLSYLSLMLPRSAEQQEIRRELTLLSQRMEIQACQWFRSPMSADVLAAQSVKAASQSIRLLANMPRTSFTRFAPRAIELAQGYFRIAQDVADGLTLQMQKDWFERLAQKLEP